MLVGLILYCNGVNVGNSVVSFVVAWYYRFCGLVGCKAILLVWRLLCDLVCLEYLSFRKNI